MNSSDKKNKKKGPFRTGAILSIMAFILISGLYFYFFFDNHIKNAAEWTSTQIYGAEVNIKKVHIGFLDAKLKVSGIQVTNKSNPAENLLAINNVEFQLVWDALLRAKFVVETTKVEGISLYSPRKSPGYIIPKSKQKTGPSKALTEIESKALEQAQSQYNQNIIGDAASMVAGTDPKNQLEMIKSELQSEAKLKELQSFIDEKKIAWEKRIKTLPNKKELDELQTEIKNLNLDTSNLKEFAASVKKAEKIIKSADSKIKSIDSAQNDLKKDLNTVNQSTQSIESYIDSDIKDLEKRLNIPSINMGDFSKTLFLGIIAEKTASYQKYYELIKDYLPPKKEKEKTVEASQLTPKKRTDGNNIKFPITTGYPTLWIKEIKISSKSTEKGFSGDLSGNINNITSQPTFLKKPITVKLTGDFKKQQITGINLFGTIDHTTDTAKQDINLKIQSFPVGDQKLVSSKDLNLSIYESIASLNSKLKSHDNQVQMYANIVFNKVNYNIKSPSRELQSFTESVVADIPVINVQTSMAGSWSKARWKVESNLGKAFSNSFKKQLNNKINQVKSDLKKQVEAKISDEKQKLNEQIKSFTDKYQTQINEVNKKANQAKAEAKKSLDSKKDNTQKKEIKKLEEKGKKLLKDLKIGF